MSQVRLLVTATITFTPYAGAESLVCPLYVAYVDVSCTVEPVHVDT